MNSTSPSSVIRQKAIVETVFELELPTRLYGPSEDSKENLYVCSQSGEIIKFNTKGEYSVSLTHPGQPTCIVFDNKDEDIEDGNEEESKHEDEYYFADVANSVIYGKKEENDVNALVKDYQGTPLKGPTSLAINTEENSLLFCDGGYFETTSLSRPTGSVFHLDLETSIVTPLLLNCLAYPADIFYDNILAVGYIAETFANRILKITENPQGVYHVSVFYVFNGRVGPTSITCDDEGNIFVSRFEYQNKDEVDGLISVLNKDGYLVGELIVPKMPEIVGMHIPRKEESKDNRSDLVLYFTERNFSGVKKIKLGPFVTEIDKAQDNYKIY